MAIRFSVYVFGVLNAPVKLFWPHLFPGQPQDQREKVCDKKCWHCKIKWLKWLFKAGQGSNKGQRISVQPTNTWCVRLKRVQNNLNATKTELIYFRNKRTPKPTTKIKLNGFTLEETTHAKYVGLVLDEYLNFKRHITLLNAKLKRANNLIAISRHYVPKDLLMQIY